MKESMHVGSFLWFFSLCITGNHIFIVRVFSMGGGKMQRDKYYETLRHIENRIAELDVETLNQLLEQTFQVKPVRLKWYLIKAQVMLKEGKKVAEIKDFLSDNARYIRAYQIVFYIRAAQKLFLCRSR